MQIIGFGENDLGADLLQLAAGHRLDGGLRTHGHEDRGLDVTMGRMDDAAAGMRLGVSLNEIKCYGLGHGIFLSRHTPHMRISVALHTFFPFMYSYKFKGVNYWQNTLSLTEISAYL